MKRILFSLFIGLGGLVLLVGLGIWQVQRLDWKQGILADIEAKLAAPPVLLPAAPNPDQDAYLTVIMEGRPTGQELRFLDSGTAAGTGHRIISAFELTDGRRVMLDQGLLPLYADVLPPLTQQITVQGNLIWPDDTSTEPPIGDEWYARDVPAMAEVLQTEPVLVIMAAASTYDPRLTPLPLNTSGIKNDHLEYAITWFLLAAVWLGMTIFYMAPMLRRKEV